MYNVGTYFLGDLGSYPAEFIDSRYGTQQQPANIQGVHSRGCGNSMYNKYYTLPRDPEVWAEYDSLTVVRDSLEDAWYDLQAAHETREVSKDFIADYNGVYRYRYNSTTQEYQYFVYVYESDSDSIAFINTYIDYSLAYNAVYDAEDDAYTASIPVYQAAVEQMILDEEALEGMFEGLRFYDLMRYAMYHNDRDYIANQVARRLGAGKHDSRADALKGGNWYLPLP